MMSEEPEIVLYSQNFCSPELLVKMYQAVSHISPVSEFLISNDPNFSTYLENYVLVSSSDFCFLLKLQNKVIGFAHLKSFDNELFLNKIYINPSYQGGGNGKRLLLRSLKHILQTNKKETFSLDVFESNKAALRWYYKIGMALQKKVFWYKIKPLPSYKGPNKSDVCLERDKHGFWGLFLKGDRIGSHINNNFIINEPCHIRLFSDKSLKNSCLKTEQFLFDCSDISFRAIDASHRLSINIKSAIEAFS